MTVKINRWIHAAAVMALGAVLLSRTPGAAQDTPPAELPHIVAETNQAPVNAGPDGAETNPVEAVTPAPDHQEFRREWRHRDEPMIVIGNNAELPEGDEKDAVIVVFGNSVIKGNVRGDAISVFGNVTSSGKVRNAIIAVLGNLHLSGESGDVFTVLGNVTLADTAVVKGDVFAVGGKVIKSPNAVIEGNIINPVDFGLLPGLRDWLVECVLLARPLSLDVAWVWAVAAAFLLFYILVAVALPKPVQSCVAELTRRPITSFFLGMVTLPLALIICVILAITGIGLIIVVFLLPALLFAGCVGKVGLLQYLGEAIRRATGTNTPFSPLVALLVGAVLVTLLYLIPFLGLFAFAVTGLWGLGAAISATFGGMKRELPEKPAPPAAMPPGGATPNFVPTMPISSAGPEAAAFTTTPSMNTPTEPWPTSQTSSEPTASASPLAVPIVPEGLAFPRASFWQRMAAIFLDGVVVSFLIALFANLLPRPFDHPPFIFLIPLAYFVGMWAWKNTTIGGIVLGLKVVRQDNGKVTFAVALVRSLSSLLSFFVLFLGFIWIAWDPEKQAWHDRIAGTVVIRLPRGTPLVLL